MPVPETELATSQPPIEITQKSKELPKQQHGMEKTLKAVQNTRDTPIVDRLRLFKNRLLADTKEERISSLEEAAPLVWQAENLYNRRLHQLENERAQLDHHMQIIYEVMETKLADDEYSVADELKPVLIHLKRIAGDLKEMVGSSFANEEKLLTLQDEVNDLENVYASGQGFPVGTRVWANPNTPKNTVPDGQAILNAITAHIHRQIFKIQDHVDDKGVSRTLLPTQLKLVGIRAALQALKQDLEEDVAQDALKQLSSLGMKLDEVEGKMKEGKFVDVKGESTKAGQAILRELLEQCRDLMHECYLMTESTSTPHPMEAIRSLRETMTGMIDEEQLEMLRAKLSAAWEDVRDFVTKPGTTSDSPVRMNPQIPSMARRLASATVGQAYDLVGRLTHAFSRPQEESNISKVTKDLLDLRDDLRDLRDRRVTRMYMGNLAEEYEGEGGVVDVSIEDGQKLEKYQQRLDDIDSQREGDKWVESDGTVLPGQAAAADLLNSCYLLVSDLLQSMD